MHRALPPGPRFRHAFTRLQRARSERLTGSSPGAAGPHAVRRFLQLCGSPSTTSGSPNPAGVFSETEAPAPWVARVPCGPHQPDRPRSGVARYVFLVACRTGARRAVRTKPPCGRSRDPRISVRGADTDLPQPDNDPDTPCRLLVRAEPGKSVSACDRAEHPRVKYVVGCFFGPSRWRASSPTRGAEAPRACRAASPGHPRKRPSSANPRCLPPGRPVAFRLRREPWILSSRVGYLLQPESLCTFVSAGGRQPGRAVVPSARPPVSGTSH